MGELAFFLLQNYSFCKRIAFSKPLLFVLVFYSKPIKDCYSGWGNVCNSLLLFISLPWSCIWTMWGETGCRFSFVSLVAGRLYSTKTRWMALSEVDVFVTWAIYSCVRNKSGRQEGLFGLAAQESETPSAGGRATKQALVCFTACPPLLKRGAERLWLGGFPGPSRELLSVHFEDWYV